MSCVGECASHMGPCLVCWMRGDVWYLGLLMLRGEVHLDKVSGGRVGTVSICLYQDMCLCVSVYDRGTWEESLGSLVTGGGSDCTCMSHV